MPIVESAAPLPVRVGGVEMLSMTVPRALHAAVRLDDGKVLICGGSPDTGSGEALNSAELYDPELGSFVPTGGMKIAREGETATLLRNGAVLIAGGAGGVGLGATLASAELYDPATGVFRPTGSMTTAREGHTATLLSDGRVLIAGGSSDGVNALTSAEIYDPKSGRFTPAAPMAVAREGATATLLKNGRVLVAGGGRSGSAGGYTVYDSAETFNPASGEFTKLGAHMVSARVGHAAALLRDGRVLLVGGKSGKTQSGSLEHGLFALTPLATAEVFDPKTGRFTTVGAMLQAHYLATATALDDGTVLVAGGWELKGPVVVGMRDAELFDPAANAFSRVEHLHVGRLENTATLLESGRVVLTGGIDDQSDVTATAEVYVPSMRNFVPRPFQRYERHHDSVR